MKIERALVSVSDKRGVVDLARELADLGVEILSTGGTAKALSEAGVPIVNVSDYTGQPEILDGRVKTLHPKIHAGLLNVRDDVAHQEQMQVQGFGGIDLVVVNLYPFEATVAKPDCRFADAIENIDIGGPTMLRSAAKNHAYVTVVVEPEDYSRVIEEMRAHDGAVSADTRRELAKKVFRKTAAYDGAIADYLGSVQGEGPERAPFGETLHLRYEKAQDLRYGENPHQSAAFYREPGVSDLQEPNVSAARQLHGKALSYNNIVDANAALELVKEIALPAAVAIKHTNPCGAGTSATSLAEAFEKCRQGDPVSIFGGIVGCNREVDLETAKQLAEIFLEIVIAPSFSPEALELYKSKKKLANCRLLEVPFPEQWEASGLDFAKVVGGLLVQDRDLGRIDLAHCKVATRRAPTDEEWQALDFAWRIAKHVKSNAIVYANADQLIGIGAGQMNRLDSARIGVQRAEQNSLRTKGTVVASDAFFPFRDGLDACVAGGATAVIQPGGSVRDDEVIAAADEHGIAMVFTGMRHFKH